MPESRGYNLETIRNLIEPLFQPNEAGVVDLEGLSEFNAGKIAALVERFHQFTGRAYPPAEHPGCQHGEERPLFAILKPATQPGSYVDVGASDPTECSNTWELYKYGWRGLLIEPSPGSWSAILSQRPGDMLCPVAASDVRDFGVLYEASALSSLQKNWAWTDADELGVETKTLAAILEGVPQIRDTCRLCSIDVEGYELQVLRGIDFATFHPEMFIIEYRDHKNPGPGNDTSAPWLPILWENGYDLIDRSELNMIFLHRDKRQAWDEVRAEAMLCDPAELEEYKP